MSDTNDSGLVDRRSVLIAAAAALGSAAIPSGIAAAPIADASHDFDFLFGTWSVRHRWLRDGKIIEFEGDSTTRPIGGGMGNLEEALIHSPKGSYHGAALRLFQPSSGTWSIWWIDGRNPEVIPPPLVGTFVNGVGTLVATDPTDHSMARFIWKNITPMSAHWEQATSVDGGMHWQTNWDMEFQRLT